MESEKSSWYLFKPVFQSVDFSFNYEYIVQEPNTQLSRFTGILLDGKTGFTLMVLFLVTLQNTWSSKK